MFLIERGDPTLEVEYRAVVSADISKSKKVWARIKNSKYLLRLFSSFKKDLYSRWFSSVEKYGFIPKDVSGDNFWVLSSIKEKNLKQSIIKGIHLGLDLNKDVVDLCSDIKYEELCITGAHVSVGPADIEFLVLGNEKMSCLDINSASFGTLDMLGKRAQPGEVLLDLHDKEMLEDLENIFILKKNIDIYHDNSFLDAFAEMPNIYIVLGRKENSIKIAS